MMEQSATIAELGAALAKAQPLVEGALKSSSNPAFRSKYADLSSVWDAVRKPLAENDLAVVQFPGEMADGRITLTTQIIHKSGEWMRATASVPVNKPDAHGYGSALTYARRYSLGAILGVCPEDDDGNAAVSGARPSAGDAKISDEQRHTLMALAEASGADMKAFCTVYRIAALNDLPAAQFERARSQFQKKITDKAAADATANEREAA